MIKKLKEIIEVLIIVFAVALSIWLQSEIAQGILDNCRLQADQIIEINNRAI